MRTRKSKSWRKTELRLTGICFGQCLVIVYMHLMFWDQFGEATMWPVREYSVYESSAALISSEILRVAAKLVCGGGLLLTPLPSTR